MSPAPDIGLPEALERAASELRAEADSIRPANGDPFALLSLLDSDGATRVLEWLLRNEPAAGAELVGAWVDADATEPLLRVEADGLPKAARKALRRAHHRLRSQGESIPESGPREVVATLPKLDEQLEMALVSAVDPRGMRMAYLVESHPSGGARMFVAALDDLRGVVELDVFNAGRSKVRKFVRDFTQRAEFPAVEASADSVRALIAAVVARHTPDRPPPRAFAEWRSKLAKPGDGAKTPGQLAREALSGHPTDLESATSRILELVGGMSIGPWPPDRDDLQAVAAKLRDAASGVVIVSEAAKHDQIQATLEQAVDDLYGDDLSEVTAVRLDESAYVLWKRGRDDDAAACLAVADAFRDRSAESRRVAQAMLELVLQPVLDSLRKSPEPDDESSVLVKP